MNNTSKNILQVVGIFLLLFLLVGVFTISIVSIQSFENKIECEKLDGYGYVVKLEGGFFSHICKVKTERGVWIESRDFDITLVEEFRLK